MDTIAAVATPPGEGALGIVRIAGPQALAITLGLTKLKSLAPRKATLVSVCDEHGHIDQGIAVYYPAENSPIGEDLVELTLHGSTYILQRTLLQGLKTARLALPGEFTQRAFLNGRLDLAQAEAVCALIRARTQTSHRAALRQLSGGLSDAVRRCRQPLFDLLVRVEASLDHPEEDLPSLTPAAARAALAAARIPIEALAASYRKGRLAVEGARLALIGRPNAGKSSLFNALLGRERAIVRPEPGTTRDTLEEPFEIAGLPAVLIATAGLREDFPEPAERAGAERAERALESCDLAVLVVDGARAPDPEDLRVHRRLLQTVARRGTPLVAALNKADLGLARRQDVAQAIGVSAVKGTGLSELRRRIASKLGADGGLEPACVTSARHYEALRAAAAALEGAGQAVGALGSAWEDRAACHLREAVSKLGLILGEGAPDEALREVFSRFCMGK